MKHVIGFHSCNLGHGGEDMRAVYSSPLQTVAMVDLPLSCLLVYVKLHEIGNKIRLKWGDYSLLDAKLIFYFFANSAELRIYRSKILFYFHNNKLLVTILM